MYIIQFQIEIRFTQVFFIVSYVCGFVLFFTVMCSPQTMCAGVDEILNMLRLVMIQIELV